MSNQVKNIQWLAWLGPLAALVVTGLGYAIAYIYEYGFATELGIPLDFIKLDSISIIRNIFALVFVFGVMACIIRFVLIPLLKKEGQVYDSLGHLIAYLTGTIPFVLLYWKLWTEWIWLVLAMVVIWFLADVVPRLWKLRRPIREAVQSQEADNHSKMGIIYLVIWVLFVILATPYITGISTAKQKEDYIVIRMPDEYVALRLYDDRIIAAPLNRERREFEPIFIILKPGDNPTAEMELQRVGPLKPSKDNESL
jgi:hypothetical protein